MVPDKIFGLTLILDFIDHCHSLRSLLPPQAALPSLPFDSLSLAQDDTCGVNRCYTAKLSFSAKMIDAQARLLLEEKLSKIFDF